MRVEPCFPGRNKEKSAKVKRGPIDQDLEPISLGPNFDCAPQNSLPRGQSTSAASRSDVRKRKSRHNQKKMLDNAAGLGYTPISWASSLTTCLSRYPTRGIAGSNSLTFQKHGRGSFGQAALAEKRSPVNRCFGSHLVSNLASSPALAKHIQ
jgi:hypothetical protein